MKAAEVVVELVAPKGFTYNGSQFEMFVTKVLMDEPWCGQSPRGLTAAFGKFSLGAHPPGGLIRNA